MRILHHIQEITPLYLTTKGEDFYRVIWGEIVEENGSISAAYWKLEFPFYKRESSSVFSNGYWGAIMEPRLWVTEYVAVQYIKKQLGEDFLQEEKITREIIVI